MVRVDGSPVSGPPSGPQNLALDELKVLQICTSHFCATEGPKLVFGFYVLIGRCRPEISLDGFQEQCSTWEQQQRQKSPSTSPNTISSPQNRLWCSTAIQTSGFVDRQRPFVSVSFVCLKGFPRKQHQFLAKAPGTIRFQTHQKSPLTPQNMISSPQKTVLDGFLPSGP